MPKIKDISAVELLVEANVPEETARARVMRKVAEEQSERPAPAAKEKKDYIVIIVDPKGVCPKDLTCYVAKKARTNRDEETYEETEDAEPRLWGDEELMPIMAAVRAEVIDDDPKYGDHSLDEFCHVAKKALKLAGVELQHADAVSAIPVNLTALDAARS